MAEDLFANESAVRKDLRTARCEDHDHREKPQSKWLGKFKKIKYGPSKFQHRSKSHYGQPEGHFRPPPQYVRTNTNQNIPPYNPASALPPSPTSYHSYPYPTNVNTFIPQNAYAPVKFYGSPPQGQSFNRPAPPLFVISSTEAPIPPTYSHVPYYPQDPEESEDPEDYSPPEPVHNPATPYSVPQVPVSSPSYDPSPSPNHLEIPDPDPPAINSSPVSTEASINHTSSFYSDVPYTQTNSLPTVTHDSQNAAKAEEFSYSYSSVPISNAPPISDPPVDTSSVSTEGAGYHSSPPYSQSESENPPAPVSSTPVYAPSNDPFTHSLPVTDAPDYFPPSLSDDYSQSNDDDDSFPELPFKRKPASYSPLKFPSYDSPLYTPPFFMEPPVISPPTYSDHRFLEANNRQSAKTPVDTYSNEDETDQDGEGYFENHDSFPRFDQFIQQMMRKSNK
jgi:hypothetical protein